MKKTLKWMVVIIFMISCNKENNQTEISTNPIFVEMIKMDMNLASKITDLEGLSSATEINIHKYLKFETQSDMQSWYQDYNTKKAYLKTNYKLSDKEWQNAFHKTTTLLIRQNFSTMSGDDGDRCTEYFINRLASISATAAGGHFACAFLDISFVGGIMCHGAVFVYQISESNLAQIELKQCRASSYR